MIDVVVALLMLGVGGGALLWGAEEFMEHVADLARSWRLPVVAAGLLLAGAEPEELATAVTASAQGHPVLAVTDAFGANITMVTLGLGLAVLIATVRVDATLRRYAVTAAACGLLALVVLWDGVVGRGEGAALILVYAAVVAGIWRFQRTPPQFGELAEVDDDDDDLDDDDDPDDEGRDGDGRDGDGDEPHRSGRGRRTPVLMVLAGLVAMVLGGALAVRGAEGLAEASGLGETATGLTALAFATSVEVLALVAAARRRGLTSVAVGGVLGSVVYNATVTLGASALVSPVEVPDLRLVTAAAAVLPLTVLVAPRGVMPRTMGLGLALAYVGYLALVIGLA